MVRDFPLISRLFPIYFPLVARCEQFVYCYQFAEPPLCGNILACFIILKLHAILQLDAGFLADFSLISH
jgi:hypothetical protein